MTCYLDIRATRIQHWLTRTSGLKHRKGASSLLVETTSKAAVSPGLPTGAEWNAHAGDVDGVVSLCFTPEAGETDEQAARRIGRSVVTRIQRRLPSLGFEATWTKAADYGTAYGELALKQAVGDFAYDAPPVTTELVLAMRCPECAVQPAQPPAAHDGREEDEQVAPCPECQEKRAMQHRTGKKVPRSERILVEQYLDAVQLPTEFEKLARSAPGETQLALIFADGNRVGAFIAGAAAARAGSKTDLANALKESTEAALGAAVDDGSGVMLPAIPHLVGGDDVLLTVRAIDAWRVTRRFVRAFAAKLESARQPGWPAELPTISAGLLFHHFAEPFPYALARCEELLDDAKHAHQGGAATIGFADLTYDGEDVSGTQQGRNAPVTLDWLESRASDLDALAATLAPAQRASLQDLARLRPDSSGTLRPSPDLGRKIIEQHNRPLLKLLYADGLRDINRVISDTDAAQVRKLLAILRWWR